MSKRLYPVNFYTIFKKLHSHTGTLHTLTKAHCKPSHRHTAHHHRAHCTSSQAHSHRHTAHSHRPLHTLTGTLHIITQATAHPHRHTAYPHSQGTPHTGILSHRHTAHHHRAHLTPSQGTITHHMLCTDIGLKILCWSPVCTMKPLEVQIHW